MTKVEETSTANPHLIIQWVRRLTPFHSARKRPTTVPKMMMLAMCKVQLEKSYLPIFVVPIP